jgi:hypothetical protein
VTGPMKPARDVREVTGAKLVRAGWLGFFWRPDEAVRLFDELAEPLDGLLT